MLHVRLCQLQRGSVDDPFGFELWRSKRKSSSADMVDKNFGESLVIKAIYDGSPAQRSRLREGDKIIAVNGVNVRDPQNVKNLLSDVLDAKIMVERWEGGQATSSSSRKTSIPVAPPKTAPKLDRRRRSNTMNTGEANGVFHGWPRSSRNTCTDPNCTFLAESNTPTSSEPMSRVSFSNDPNSAHLATTNLSLQRPGVSETRTTGTIRENRRNRSASLPEENGVNGTSVLDAFPQERFILSIAGRGFYSEDLRGD